MAQPTSQTDGVALVLGSQVIEKACQTLEVNMEDDRFLLGNALPELAEKIKQGFIQKERADLSEQIDALRIVALCGCGDKDCGSFYTVTPPNEEDEDSKVEGIAVNGYMVEIYDGKISYIEIMPSPYGSEIHKRLDKLFNYDSLINAKEKKP